MSEANYDVEIKMRVTTDDKERLDYHLQAIFSLLLHQNDIKWVELNIDK